MSGNLMLHSYAYDANGSITDITDELASLDRSYDYDKLDRLKAHSGPDGNYTYTYRLNGNRKTKTIAGATTTYNYYPGTNRLNTLTGAESENRDYDANGNTTAIDAEVYTYNAANRLASYRPSAGGALTEYQYNGLGERVFKNRSGSKQRFVYDGNGLLLHERGSMGTRDYIYLNGEPVALVKNGELYYIHNDHLGRPEAASDANGVSAWSIEANAWSSDTPIGGLWAFNLRFPGQYFDVESGNYYNYFRTYDPSTGRYLASDPIGLFGGLNTYGYVAGNPLRFTDPYGLDVTINIVRTGHTANSNTGVITASSDVTGASYVGDFLENRNPPNPNLPTPPGTYDAFVDKRQGRKDRVELLNVPKATDIQIHLGNKPSDLEGCFAPGTATGTPDWVSNSGAAMDQILDIIKQDGTGNIDVNVYNNDPNP